MTRVPSDVAFTAAVKAQQSARGSRDMFERMEDTRPWPDRITPDLAEFVAAQRSVYLGTASAAGQPYIQHRGGPPGFLRVVDDTHLGFADLRGNRQYITLGNLAENPHAFLFLIDYTNARRVKLWGTAKVVEDDPALLESLVPADGKGRPERAILFQIAAWDVNCPQHIPQRFEAEDVAAALARRDTRIAELEAEIARLKA
ncbi:pyridoxamine 5'-phosphate oxidase family protein [Acuticoccus sp. I52.16.1]|uniref:pyridoxamine 5'-phosphate oxidase family protein n=1 Tax=Acuticoccus sp. I52.16.1 TaxID=2928472 RepID=UPI001FD05D43|nr:pyridoxamine 5'-phosphate oxidase family protein [Acuticoccus sp. I52.16.1]UOM32617.1 pyridoxamine 5'-phosphate oxidase family protein [Acuticoccus sp. I52.16.1]